LGIGRGRKGTEGNDVKGRGGKGKGGMGRWREEAEKRGRA